MMPEFSGASKDGYASVLGFKLYYRIFGEPGEAGTVLCLHGGPGVPHGYLAPLVDLTRYGYRVVLFDQLGVGRSDLPSDPALFTLAHNVEEVEAIRGSLELGRVHLMGSSYGGLLALAYAAKYQQHLRSLVISGGLASMPLTIAEMNRLRSELPSDTRSILAEHEALGEFENPEYLRAVDEFCRRHVCRLPVWPPEVVETFAQISKAVYHYMNGPNEFTIVGTLRDVDITDQLPTIRIPCLVTVGEFDEVTPNVARGIQQHIAGARLVIFPNASHLHFWEARDRYIETVVDFLRALA